MNGFHETIRGRNAGKVLLLGPILGCLLWGSIFAAVFWACSAHAAGLPTPTTTATRTKTPTITATKTVTATRTPVRIPTTTDAGFERDNRPVLRHLRNMATYMENPKIQTIARGGRKRLRLSGKSLRSGKMVRMELPCR